MANYLKMTKTQQLTALLALGWSFRRVERETEVRRETISKYARLTVSNPANVFPGSGGVAGHQETRIPDWGTGGARKGVTFASAALWFAATTSSLHAA